MGGHRRILVVIAGAVVAVIAGVVAWHAAAGAFSSTADEWLRADVGNGVVAVTQMPPARQIAVGSAVFEDVHGDGSRFLIASLDGRTIANADLHPAAHPMHGVILAPRGRRIAYVRFERDPNYEHPYADLVVAARPGARGAPVLPRALAAPAFSPDGGQLAAVQAIDPGQKGVPTAWNAPARLVVLRADGHGAPRALATDVQSAGIPPVWTRDGRIVHVARRGVVVSRPDGSGRTVLAPGRVVRWLTVAPDGLHAVLTVDDDQDFHLVVTRLDGHGTPTELPHAETAAFSPDGRLLAATHDDRVDLLSADGVRTLRRFPSTDDREIASLAWMPDRSALLYHAYPSPPPD